MDEMIIVGVILLLSLIALLIFNAIKSRGKSKKVILIVNGVLLLAMGLTYIAYSIDSHAATVGYDIYGNSLFGTIHYDREEEGYYIFKETAFLSGYEELAVPKENVEIPQISHIYDPVKLYCRTDTKLYTTQITIGSGEYYLCDSVVKVRPNYFDLTLYAEIACFSILCLFNLVTFVAVLVKTKRAAGKGE